MIKTVLITILFLLSSFAEENIKYIDNGNIRVGVNLDKGGSITYIADSKDKKNIINNFDLGRQIQMAFYSGPIPYITATQKPEDHWKHIGWNPIQSGDDFDNKSLIKTILNDKQSIQLECVPMQWPLNNVPGECTFKSIISIEGNVIHYKATINNSRKDLKQYPARHQELPAVYVNSNFYKLVTYKGDKPFTNDSLFINPDPLKPKQHWHYWNATENWAAYVNDKDYGLGVFKPKTYYFSGGFAGKPKSGGTKANSTGYIAPIETEILDHNISYEYETYFILGSLKEIRDFVYKNKPAKTNEWNFKNNRESWSTIGLTDNGWPIEGHLSAKFSGNPGAYFQSPITFWKAEKKQTLELAIKHSGRATSFYISFKNKNEVTKPFEVKIKEKDKVSSYSVDLSKIKKYSGSMKRIRIYPFSSNAGTEDKIEIHSVKLK